MKLGYQRNYHKEWVALAGAFSVIVKTDGSFAALSLYLHHSDQSRAERGRRESGVELGEQKLLP